MHLPPARSACHLCCEQQRQQRPCPQGAAPRPSQLLQWPQEAAPRSHPPQTASWCVPGPACISPCAPGASVLSLRCTAVAAAATAAATGCLPLLPLPPPLIAPWPPVAAPPQVSFSFEGQEHEVPWFSSVGDAELVSDALTGTPLSLARGRGACSPSCPPSASALPQPGLRRLHPPLHPPAVAAALEAGQPLEHGLELQSSTEPRRSVPSRLLVPVDLISAGAQCTCH